MEQFIASSAGINKDIAARSHHNISFFPEERATSEINGFAAHVQSIYEEINKHARSDTQREYLINQMVIFQGNYAHKYNDYLSAKGRCISSFITGGSNFPVRRAEKANNAEHNKYEDMSEWIERAKAAILREMKKMAVEEAGGDVEVLKRKIAMLENSHEAMVESNKIIRKSTTQEEKVKAIMDKTGLKEETVLTMFKPDYLGNIGFVGWQLQNSNANIHSAKKRLAELETKEATPTSDITFAGGSIVDNSEADRVQIHFDAIPEEAMRTKLKGEGWKWSPHNVCWQRKRTLMAMSSAKRITGAI